MGFANGKSLFDTGESPTIIGGSPLADGVKYIRRSLDDMPAELRVSAGWEGKGRDASRGCSLSFHGLDI
jgi:hypothetical protein